MRRTNQLLFDAFIAPGGVHTLTDSRFNPGLGAFDQFAIMAVIDDLTNATSTFNLWVAHSADGKYWLYRKNGLTSPPATGDISLALTGTPPIYGIWQDAGATPLLAFVRLELGFTGGSNGGHIKVYVTQRDQGG